MISEIMAARTWRARRGTARAALVALTVMLAQAARVGGGPAAAAAVARGPTNARWCGRGGAAPSVLSLRGGSCFDGVSLSADADDDDDDGEPPSRSDWKRRVLVTGGCGFMGSYLVDRLVSRYEDYLIVVLDVLDECGSLAHLSGALDHPNCVFVRGDVMPRAARPARPANRASERPANRAMPAPALCAAALTRAGWAAQIRDEQVVSDILGEYAIDTVLHLAAQTSVDHSFKDPAVFTQVNVVGTQRMLECSRKSPTLRLFLFCSTDEVCGEVAEDAVTEDCPMKPTNPYSASKAAAELLVQGYSKSFQLPCIVTRCVNVYGGRQFPEKVIPKFIMRCRRGEPCCVHGDGQARRSMVYVEDVAEAFDLVMHQGKVGNIYNIGSRDCLSVHDIADKICAATGQPGNIELVPDRLYNDCRYRAPPPSRRRRLRGEFIMWCW